MCMYIGYWRELYILIFGVIVGWNFLGNELIIVKFGKDVLFKGKFVFDVSDIMFSVKM